MGEKEILAFQLEGRQKGALEGKSRLQGELSRAAWSEAQPPIRVGVTAGVKFDKREPSAAITMGLESAGCRRNLVPRTFCCLAVLA